MIGAPGGAALTRLPRRLAEGLSVTHTTLPFVSAEQPGEAWGEPPEPETPRKWAPSGLQILGCTGDHSNEPLRHLMAGNGVQTNLTGRLWEKQAPRCAGYTAVQVHDSSLVDARECECTLDCKR